MAMRILPAAALAILVFAASSAVAQNAGQARNASPLNPEDWAPNIQQDYPVAALRSQEEGEVVMQVEVDETGRVNACEVTQSSGSVALDEAACEGMSAYARYQPALNENGEAIAAKLTQAIRYVLPNSSTTGDFAAAQPIDLEDWTQDILADYPDQAREQGLSGTSRIMIFVDPDGKPFGCIVKLVARQPVLDTAACVGAFRHSRFVPLGIPSTYEHSVAYVLPD
ncbi:MAG: energy transducer TonB [Alphaproteobacteria bacterium]|nr:energy transducer TonB [Alphaproteobacteria bacterium]